MSFSTRAQIDRSADPFATFVIHSSAKGDISILRSLCRLISHLQHHLGQQGCRLSLSDSDAENRILRVS